MKHFFTLLCAAGLSGYMSLSYAADPLLAMVDWDNETTEVLEPGTPVEIQAYYSGGEEPYTFVWLNQMNEKVGEGDLLKIAPEKSQTYRFRVTSADGQTYSAKAHVLVKTDALGVATFEDLPLEAESAWKYDEDADEYLTSDAFISGSFRFGNFPTVEYGSWGGFAYANETANTSTGFMQQFRNAAGGGADKTANYGVVYMGDPTWPEFVFDTTVRVATGTEGVIVPGMYVTNSAWTVNSVLNGDGFSPKFTADHGDYLTLIITGYDADGRATGKVQVPLAEFRSSEGAPDEGVVLTEWKWVDLSSLGAISKFEIRHDSSRLSTVPSYVCIDQIGAPNPGASVDGVGASSGMRVFMPVPDCLSVAGVNGGCTLRIYSVDGVEHVCRRLDGDATVGTAGLPAGTFIALLVADNGERATFRFIRR